MIRILTDFDEQLRMYKLPLPLTTLSRQLHENCQLITRSEVSVEDDYASIHVFWGHKPEMTEIRSMSNLRWIHLGTSGFDRLDLDYLRLRNITVTTSGEVNSESVALSALSFVLQDLRGTSYFNSTVKDQDVSLGVERRRFDSKHPFVDVASNMTILALGNGAIGRKFTQFAHNLGFLVLSLDTKGIILPTKHGEEKRISREWLHQLMSQADYLVNFLPSTPETQNFVDQNLLAASKFTLWYVSVGRWKTTNEQDLLDAIRSRRIRGASLDVYSEGLMTTASDLLRQGSLITTPHVAGNFLSYWTKQICLFRENLCSYIGGTSLQGQII
jgi:D-2-hydroxyacid dehydrogenase (NADP+)